MERYTLTNEGRARFRRMDLRANIDASADTEDFKLLHYLYVRGASTVEEIESHTGQSWNGTVNRIASLMNRGFIEGMPE